MVIWTPIPEIALPNHKLLRIVWVTYSGRYRTRTDDLFRVKEARYQLRQSPENRTVVIVSRNHCVAVRDRESAR